MEIPPRRAPDEMIRAERRALLRAVTTKALREADREVVRTPLTRKSDVRCRGQTGKHLLILSFSGFAPVVGSRADIPRPEQLVAVRIPFAPFQDPDGCETMRCVVLTPGGDYETPGVHHAGRRAAAAWPLAARARASCRPLRVIGPATMRNLRSALLWRQLPTDAR